MSDKNIHKESDELIKDSQIAIRRQFAAQLSHPSQDNDFVWEHSSSKRASLTKI